MRIAILFISLISWGTTFDCTRAKAVEAEAWESLLDKKLSKWEVFIGVPHKSVKIPGRPASTSENGQNGVPLGLGNDPLSIFSVSMVDGEPVLHITGEIYGGLTSLEEYDSYHLSLQFRWGEKKWPPRLNVKRDSGVLIHWWAGMGLSGMCGCARWNAKCRRETAETLSLWLARARVCR